VSNEAHQLKQEVFRQGVLFESRPELRLSSDSLNSSTQILLYE